MRQIFLACLVLLAGNTVLADAPLSAVNAEAFHDYLQNVQKDGDTVVLVNFWATWCQPCREEIPIFMELERKYTAKGFRLIAVSLDEVESIDSVVRPFMEKWFPGFHSLYSVEYDMDDTVSVVDSAWNEVLPTSYLYSRDGQLSERLQGKFTAAEFETRIIALLQD
jgi:thiol-disulfide isomerase/thioredoxin